MNISELVKDSKGLTSEMFERKLNKLIRENYRYKNLDSDNKKVILDITDKYRNYMRRGIGISYSSIMSEMRRLRKGQPENDLSKEDLKDIREVLDAFRK